ncbi:hypothetical protein [Neobacillus kokaensis]|uniref:DUF3194 domain-containing protein n=1 Tax=Neobacillus kokaensis TaxID=2759023 RepID=A0ABQ3N4D7_9BACI|nr:hypothetical protein [Neobacillus kokaensis]GHH98373.1 hypothetical protein AM1BK_19160 [Neobacillus kokaensis]
MSKKDELEEKLLRFALPALYKRLVDIFSMLNLHPHDVQATVIKEESGFVVTLRFAADFSQSISTHINFEQANNPDEEVTLFFEEAAEKCKTRLISDYYKMIKL